MDTQHNKPCSLFLSLTANPTAEMKAQQDALLSMTADLMDQVNPYDFKYDVDQLDYEIVSGESDGVIQHPVRHLHTLFVDEMLEMYPMDPEYYKKGAAAVGNITAVLVDWEKKYLCADKDKFYTLMSLFRLLTLACCTVVFTEKKMYNVDQRRAFVEERVAFVKLINKNNRNNPKLIFDALVAGWAKLAPLNEVIQTLIAR